MSFGQYITFFARVDWMSLKLGGNANPIKLKFHVVKLDFTDWICPLSIGCRTACLMEYIWIYLTHKTTCTVFAPALWVLFSTGWGTKEAEDVFLTHILDSWRLCVGSLVTWIVVVCQFFAACNPKVIFSC